MDEPFIPLPEELRGVSRPVLERYVFERVRQFSRVFASRLLSSVHPGAVSPDCAFNEAVAILGSSQQHREDSFSLRFSHRCRFLGCQSKSCSLCVNNPEKRCLPSGNFDECYADNQSLKSRCKADIFVEAVFDDASSSDLPSGVSLQLFLVDGESCADDTPVNPESLKELLKSDEGVALLGAHLAGNHGDGHGRILGTLQAGFWKLPDIVVTDKTDTFRCLGSTFSSFRLVARAVQHDVDGRFMIMSHIPPAVSSKFVIKTQRALNDFSKPQYPHFKDRLTRLKFIGGVTADRLRDIQTHMPGIPFTAIETVDQLRQLMVYTDQNRQLEGKLLDVLSLKGKHRHKWDYLREVLSEKIVYDDTQHRVWWTDDSHTQGVLFTVKQGQSIMDKPFGLVERVDGQPRLQVMTARDPERCEVMRCWRDLAEQAWEMPGHPGWSIVSEPMELADGQATPMPSTIHSSDLMKGVQSFQAGPGEASAWEARHSYSNTQIAPSAFHQQHSPLSPHSSGHMRPAALAPCDLSSPGAFQFTAQRAIAEVHKSSQPSLNGSGASFSSHPDLSGLPTLRLSCSDASPQQQATPVYASPPSASQRMHAASPACSPLRVHLHGLSPNASPLCSPRSASPKTERAILAPRASSFSQQRTRQASSSAEHTPNRHAPHVPILSMFGRRQDGASASPHSSGSNPQSVSQLDLQHRHSGQPFPVHRQQEHLYEQSLLQAAASKRRRASLPDYHGMLPTLQRQAQQTGLDQGSPLGRMQDQCSCDDDQEQQAVLHWQQQVAQAGGYSEQYPDVVVPMHGAGTHMVAASTRPVELTSLNARLGSRELPSPHRGGREVPSPHRLSMPFKGDCSGPHDAPESPHLASAMERHLHLSDGGMHSFSPGKRSSPSISEQATTLRTLDLAQPPEKNHPPPSFAASASANSGRSSLLHGLNFSSDPNTSRHCFSPSSPSRPSGGSGQSSMQTQRMGMPQQHHSPPTVIGNEAASSLLSDFAGPLADAQDSWFDACMDRSSDCREEALADKGLTQMLERSGSFNKLLDCMLTTASGELPDILP